MLRHPVRTLTILAVVAGVAIGAAFGLHALWTTAKQHFTTASCSVGDFSLDTDQAAVAATMVGAVTQYRKPLPDRAAVLTLAAGLQESKLTNIAPGIDYFKKLKAAGNFVPVTGSASTMETG